jgi:hypothetical protein
LTLERRFDDARAVDLAERKGFPGFASIDDRPKGFPKR